MNVFLYAFPIVGVIAHMLLAFEYGCRHLNTHGYMLNQQKPMVGPVGLHPPHPPVASQPHAVPVVWTSMARYFYGHPTPRTDRQCRLLGSVVLRGPLCARGPPRGRRCGNTLSPPHPLGGRASQTVSPGSPVGEHPPRMKTPKSTHARRRPG